MKFCDYLEKHESEIEMTFQLLSLTKTKHTVKFNVVSKEEILTQSFRFKRYYLSTENEVIPLTELKFLNCVEDNDGFQSFGLVGSYDNYPEYFLPIKIIEMHYEL